MHNRYTKYHIFMMTERFDYTDHVLFGKYPIMTSIMDHLDASDTAAFLWALGVKPTKMIWKKYLDPMRDLYMINEWIEYQKDKGIKMLLVGSDIERWIDRIERPWDGSWKEDFPITLWVMILPSDNLSQLGRLKEMIRVGMEAGRSYSDPSILDTISNVEDILGVYGLSTVRFIIPEWDSLLGDNSFPERTGSKVWKEYKSPSTQTNDIKLMFYAGLVSTDSPHSAEVDYLMGIDEQERRSKNMFAVGCDFIGSRPRCWTQWYDPNKRIMRRASTYSHERDILTIRINMKHDEMSENIDRRTIRIPLPDVLM